MKTIAFLIVWFNRAWLIARFSVIFGTFDIFSTGGWLMRGQLTPRGTLVVFLATTTFYIAISLVGGLLERQSRVLSPALPINIPTLYTLYHIRRIISRIINLPVYRIEDHFFLWVWF